VASPELQDGLSGQLVGTTSTRDTSHQVQDGLGHDPESKRFGAHLGLHHGVLREPDCQHLAKVKKLMQELMEPTVIFQLRQGKHRSLACAELVGDLMRQ
jgi:hypothetical protein